MGKYQLDAKGKAQVERYHDRHSQDVSNREKKLETLKQRYLSRR